MNQLGRITALFNNLKANFGFKQTKLKIAKTNSKITKRSKAKSRTVKTSTSKRKSVRRK